MGRREFSVSLAGGLTAAWVAEASAKGGAAMVDQAQARDGGLTAVAGIKVGHFTDERRPTGCTVILTEAGAVCGVDVRGGAPGTRETDLLDPVNTVQEVHGLVLSGGSAFGLDTATGVMRFLEERGIGFPVGAARVPIVPAAILFDLGIGDWTIRPDAEAGYKAARAAGTGPVAEGSVGAGAGATVGKVLGTARAMRGGVGTAALALPRGGRVAALVAVNSFGDVVDPDSGRTVAGVRSEDGRELVGAMNVLLGGKGADATQRGENTCIGVIATDVTLTQAEATKVAQMAQDGLARAIRPVHTPWDGDTLFALSTGGVELLPAHAPGRRGGCRGDRAGRASGGAGGDRPSRDSLRQRFRRRVSERLGRAGPPLGRARYRGWKSCGRTVERPGCWCGHPVDGGPRSGGEAVDKPPERCGWPVGQVLRNAVPAVENGRFRCGNLAGILWRSRGSTVDAARGAVEKQGSGCGRSVQNRRFPVEDPSPFCGCGVDGLWMTACD